MNIKRIGIGIVGCGKISDIYFQNLMQTFDSTQVVACADLLPKRAATKAAQYPGVRPISVDELLQDPSVEIVLNLTIPQSHFSVAMSAIKAGKNVYNEKPLCVNRQEAVQLIAEARTRKVRIGAAPDTFLGGGLQTCRKIIDDGWIGKPLAATAFMMCPGHERWHPSPEFYYQKGGGPMFDMGPYYLTALIHLLGPIKRVCASAQISFPERMITSQPKKGTKIQVEVPTHIAATMDFISGPVATMITSFDVQRADLPSIEIYGTLGTIRVPDPNTFGGPVLLYRAGKGEASSILLSHGFQENSRGLGVADMARALPSERAHRANGKMTYHVLDVMHAIHESSENNCHVLLESTCERPKPLRPGFDESSID